MLKTSALTPVQKHHALAASLVVALPFLWFTYVPGVDLPSHAAIVSVLTRLWQGDPAIATFYAPNLQPVPYHLFYGVAVLLALWTTPYLATKLLLVAGAIIYVVAVELLRRALERPWWLLWATLPFYFGFSFFYGFLVMQVGLPCLLLLLACVVRELSEPHRANRIGLVVAGTLTTMSHVLWSPAVALILGAAWWVAPHRWRLWCLAGLCLSLPLWPTAIAMLGGHQGGLQFSYPTLGVQLYYLKQQIVLMDRGVGAFGIGLCALVGVSLWLAAIRMRWTGATAMALPTPVPRKSPQRLLLLVTAGLWLLYLALPLSLSNRDETVWGLNLRYFSPALISLLLTAPAPSRRGWQRTLTAMAGVGACCWYLGLVSVWHQVNDAFAAFEPVLQALPANKTLQSLVEQERLGMAWPPLMLHAHALYVANDGGLDAQLFAGGHLPIRAMPPANTPCESPPCVSPYDYLLVQQFDGRKPSPVPSRGVLVVRHGAWQLYARERP